MWAAKQKAAQQAVQPVAQPGPQKVAQQAAHSPQHRGGLGAAAQRGGDVVAVLAGETKAIGVVGLGQDDVDSDIGIQRVGGMQRGDRGHGEVISRGEGLGRVGGMLREAAAKAGEGFVGDGCGEVGEGMHDAAAPLRW